MPCFVIPFSSSEALRGIVGIGDILLAVNNHNVLNEEYEDIAAFIDILRYL